MLCGLRRYRRFFFHQADFECGFCSPCVFSVVCVCWCDLVAACFAPAVNLPLHPPPSCLHSTSLRFKRSALAWTHQNLLNHQHLEMHSPLVLVPSRVHLIGRLKPPPRRCQRALPATQHQRGPRSVLVLGRTQLMLPKVTKSFKSHIGVKIVAHDISFYAVYVVIRETVEAMNAGSAYFAGRLSTHSRACASTNAEYTQRSTRKSWKTGHRLQKLNSGKK